MGDYMSIQEQDKSDVKGLRDWYHVFDGSFYHPHEAKICKIYLRTMRMQCKISQIESRRWFIANLENHALKGWSQKCFTFGDPAQVVDC